MIPTPNISAGSSATASAGSGADGASDGMFGDFNFKSASGAATVGGVSPWLLAGGVLVLGAFAWFVLRKQFRN